MKGGKIFNSLTNYQDERRWGGTRIISVYPPPPQPNPHIHFFCICTHSSSIINRLKFLPLFSSTSAHVYASLQTTSWTPCWSCHFFSFPYLADGKSTIGINSSRISLPSILPPQTDTIITSLCFATMQLLKPFRYKAALL